MPSQTQAKNEDIKNDVTNVKENQTKSWFERREDQWCDIDIVAAWCCKKENYKAWRNRDVNRNEIGELVLKDLIKFGHPARTPKDCEGAIQHLEFFFESVYRALNEKGGGTTNPKEREIMLTNISKTFPWYKELEPVMGDRPIDQPSDPHDIRSIQDNCLAWLLRLERDNESRVNDQNKDTNVQQGSKSTPMAQISQQNQCEENLGLPIIPDDGLAKSATWSSDKEEEEEEGYTSRCDCSECSPSHSNSKLPKKRRRTETTSIESETSESLDWKKLIRKYCKSEPDQFENRALEIKTKLLDCMNLVLDRRTREQNELKEAYFKKVDDQFRNKIRMARSKMIVELIYAGVEKEKACEIARKSLADERLTDDEDQSDVWGN